MTFETVVGCLGAAILGGLGLVFLLAPDRVVTWARRRLSARPIHPEPSYVRSLVLGGGYRGFIVLMGVLLLLGALLLITGLIWGEPPTRHGTIPHLRGSWNAFVRP